MRLITLLLGLSLATFIAQVILFFSGIVEPFDLIYVAMAGLAAISTAIAAKEGYSPTNRRILGSFSIGLLLWTVAEAIWMYYELILGIEVPFPSPADLFWTIGYLPMIYAAYLRRKEMFVAKSRRIAASIISIAMLTVLIAILFAVLQDMSGFGFVLGLLYAAFDYLFAMFSLDVLLTGETGIFMRPWMLFAASFFIFSVYDVLFAIFTKKGTYYTGHPIDLMYSFSYLLIAFSAFYMTKYPKLQMVQSKFTIPTR